MLSNMKSIKPPILKAILAAHFDAVADRLPHAKPTDSKGRYLPWTEFKHRHKQPEIEWAAVKLARQTIAQPLPLSAENGLTFSYAVPESFQPYLHTIDRLAKPLLAERKQDSALFFAQSLIEEAISSAQLEGASTTRQAAKAMLDNDRAPRNEHERMVANNYALMRHAADTSQEPLSIALIQRFHTLAVNQTENPHVEAGAFRADNRIFVQDADGHTVHQPPSYEQIPSRLQALCDFANTDHTQPGHFIHPAIKAAILHFMMGYEHPFADGNGRTARALFYWFMLKQGYAAFEYLSISTLLKQAPTQYGMAYLHSETDDNDLTYFIDYQLRTINRAINAFSAYIEARQQQHADTLQWLLQTKAGRHLNERQADILSKAIKHTGRMFTVKEIMHDYQISTNTAKTDLRGLAAIKVLAEVKQGREMLFVAMPDIVERLNAV